MKHLLKLLDWSTEEILSTLDLADRLKEEKKKGTGMAKSSQKKREDDIRAAFWGLK